MTGVRRLRGLLVAALSTVGIAGCGKKPTEPASFSLQIEGGDHQVAEVARPLPGPVTLIVRDRGDPASGISVAFAVRQGGGIVAPASAVSDGNGRVTFGWTLGTTAGDQSVTVTGPGGLTTTISATATPGPLVGMEGLSPLTQFTVIGRSVGSLPAVKLVDRFGNGIPSIPVLFEQIFPADGVIDGAAATTDARGEARLAGWSIGRSIGQHSITATSGNLSVLFSAVGTPAALVAITPNQQSGNVGTKVAVAPAVTAVDGEGEPVAGVEIAFSVVTGGGSVDGGTGATGRDGRFQAKEWSLGIASGEQRLEAVTPGVAPVPFFATAADPPPAAMTGTVSSLTGWYGNYLAAPPQVQVVDGAGRPVGGKTVTFELVNGGGVLSRAAAALDRTGRATLGGWRLGAGGPQEVRATLPGLAPVSFPVAAGPVPASGYRVQFRYLGGTPGPAIDSVFQAAAARWGSLIVGDLPDVPIDFPADQDECYPAIHEIVDDVVIYVEILQIDGVGGILGAAGPCLVRDESLLPVVGGMFLDADDLGQLRLDGQLGDVIVHELAHVMGFGETLWRLKGLFGDGPAGTAVFLGSSAKAAHSAIAPLTAATEVPIETGFGPGTRFSHWRESVFGNELMTGFADAVNPLSAVSAAAMRDLGYLVNDALADPFTFADALARINAAASARGAPAHSVPWKGPLVTVDRRGRRIRALR